MDRLHITRLPAAVEILLAVVVLIAAAYDLRFWRIFHWLVPIGLGIIAAGVLLFRGGLRRTVLNVLSILGALIRFRAPFRERPELDVADSRAVTLPHGFAIAIGSLLFIALSHDMH